MCGPPLSPFFAIRSGVTIAAPIPKVWAILVDFPRYAEWNPYIRSIAGEAREGTRLEVCVVPPQHREQRYAPVVLKAAEGEELRWRGRLRHGLTTVEHSFRFEPDGTGTRFRQDASFSGFLVRFVGEEKRSAFRGGIEEMNAALKRRAEG